MNSFIKYIPESLNDNKAFVEHMLSIIDTKLQFIKHQTNALIYTYSSVPSLENNHQAALLENFSMDLNAPTESEEVFILIEKYSKTTNLLLLIRSKLTKKNVSLIYDLLTDNRFLNYENEYLDKMLENSMY